LRKLRRGGSWLLLLLKRRLRRARGGRSRLREREDIVFVLSKERREEVRLKQQAVEDESD